MLYHASSPSQRRVRHHAIASCACPVCVSQYHPTKTHVPLAVILGVGLVVVLAIICAVGAVGTIPTRSFFIPKNTNADASEPQTIVNTATLGGTLGDFVQRYGTSIDESGLMYAGTLAGQRVLIIVTLDTPRQSRDGRSHIIVIDAQVPGDALGIESWSGDTADAIARAFLPADAQFQQTIMIHGIVDHIYQSGKVGVTIMPGQFTAVNDTGTLNYYCHAWPPPSLMTGYSSGYGQCHISIGSE